MKLIYSIFAGAGLSIIAFIAYIVWKEIEFRHYDYRELERNGTSSRPDAKQTEQEYWVNNFEYDPETKSFKHRNELHK